jgi:hypothetical protein
MNMINYKNNSAKYGRAGLIYSSNEYIDITISNATFDQNFILNDRDQKNIQIKAGHFYID